MSNTTSPVTRKTLVDHVEAQLRRAVLFGDLGHASRINEVTLARELGVSPTPVREALRRLESSGLVRYEPWRGYGSAEFSDEDVAHLFDVRIALERMAVLEAAARLDDAGLRFLDASLQRWQAEASETDLEHVHALNEEFHGFFVHSSGNRWLRQLIGEIADLSLLVRADFSRVQPPTRSLAEHGAIVDALRRGDAAGAAAAMEAHLARVRDDTLAFRRSGALAPRARPEP